MILYTFFKDVDLVNHMKYFPFVFSIVIGFLCLSQSYAIAQQKYVKLDTGYAFRKPDPIVPKDDSRPSYMQFLEYSIEPYSLDQEAYMYVPDYKIVDLVEEYNLKLKFKVGRTEMDMSDSSTVTALTSLKVQLDDICNAPNSELYQISFYGYSSPEGAYDVNRNLASLRTDKVCEEVCSIIPEYFRECISVTSNGNVSGWNEMADLLEKDSYSIQASDIRKIVSECPDSWDKQNALIRKLPYYTSLISPRLPELRRVVCKYRASVPRPLNPETLLEKYNSDEGYRKGLKLMTLNEYWHLFRLIKDEDELENLYRIAINSVSKSSWESTLALPANNLAVKYLQRGQIDTTLLKPYLLSGDPLNYCMVNMTYPSVRYYYNLTEIVANQAQMYILAGDFEHAVQLTNKVCAFYPFLDAVTKLVGGYCVKLTEEIVGQIAGYSSRNNVIMRLYQEQFDDTTRDAIRALSKDDALTDYLMAHWLCGKYRGVELQKATPFARELDPEVVLPADRKRKLAKCTAYDVICFYLKRCFERDSKFIDIAREDYRIPEALLNDALK